MKSTDNIVETTYVLSREEMKEIPISLIMKVKLSIQFLIMKVKFSNLLRRGCRKLKNMGRLKEKMRMRERPEKRNRKERFSNLVTPVEVLLLVRVF